MYEVEIETAAAKQIARLHPHMQARVRVVIDGLAVEPRPHGCVKLGARNGYRVRIGGLRVIYLIEDTIRVVTITRVGYRGDVYK
jgi:mRNA interferase RelE/StbE